MKVTEEITKRAQAIDQIIEEYLPREEGPQATILEAMNYSVRAGGKRLRPMLMQETYRLFGGESKVVEPFMAAIEMIHTYSLVHDDLPAMDNDLLRRGKPTTHAVYGEAMGILAGDALLNYAFETAIRAFSLEPLNPRIPQALEKAFAESDTVIIEKSISGREIDCGVYSGPDGVRALPLIEIIPRNEFFDYEAKYLGASSEICPAPVPDADRIKIQEEAVRIFKRLGCTGLVRMDFILGVDGRPYFLEINPNPGMTAASLVPQMVREAGMTMEDFLTGIIDRTE